MFAPPPRGLYGASSSVMGMEKELEVEKEMEKRNEANAPRKESGEEAYRRRLAMSSHLPPSSTLFPSTFPPPLDTYGDMEDGKITPPLSETEKEINFNSNQVGPQAFPNFSLSSSTSFVAGKKEELEEPRETFKWGRGKVSAYPIFEREGNNWKGKGKGSGRAVAANFYMDQQGEEEDHGQVTSSPPPPPPPPFYVPSTITNFDVPPPPPPPPFISFSASPTLNLLPPAASSPPPPPPPLSPPSFFVPPTFLAAGGAAARGNFISYSAPATLIPIPATLSPAPPPPPPMIPPSTSSTTVGDAAVEEVGGAAFGAIAATTKAKEIAKRLSALGGFGTIISTPPMVVPNTSTRSVISSFSFFFPSPSPPPPSQSLDNK